MRATSSSLERPKNYAANGVSRFLYLKNELRFNSQTKPRREIRSALLAIKLMHAGECARPEMNKLSTDTDRFARRITPFAFDITSGALCVRLFRISVTDCHQNENKQQH